MDQEHHTHKFYRHWWIHIYNFKYFMKNFTNTMSINKGIVKKLKVLIPTLRKLISLKTRSLNAQIYVSNKFMLNS